MAGVASFSDVSILAPCLTDSVRMMASRRNAVFDDVKGDESVNGLKRAVVVTAIAAMGLVACGDDTNSPAPAATTPAPIGTEVMTDGTEVMTDGTTTTGG